MHKRSILFIDVTCPKPYDLKTLQSEGLGGTEATTIRIAEGLAQTGMFNVAVEQHCRQEASRHAAQYLSPNSAPQADYVIVLRDPRALLEARGRFPRSKVYVWAHDLATRALGDYIDLVINARAKYVCVSQFHKLQTTETLRPFGFSVDKYFPMHVIYNPVDDTLKPDGTQYDPNKLVFFSSPHKGLEHTLRVFESLRRFNPDFKLLVSNPGYYPDAFQSSDAVTVTGPLPHSEALTHVRSSLCVLYPNMVFPETFGLVFAEANAVGTPVITHPFGAAREVLDHPAQLIDCNKIENVVNRVLAWHSGSRPVVRVKPEFRLGKVIRSWLETILN